MALRRMHCICAALCASLPLAAGRGSAADFDGRYIGTVAHVTGPGVVAANQMQHQFDLGARSTTPAGLDLDLRTSLRYLSQLEGSNTDLFRYRFDGQLRGDIWRVRGQFVPYQATSFGARPSHERSGQLGFLLAPLRLPSLALDYVRREHDSPGTINRSDDLRAAISYAGPRAGGLASYRRITAEMPTALSTSSTIDEWRGELHAGTVWRGVTATGEYELLVSDYAARARRRDLHTQRVAGNLNWNPVERVTVGGGVLERWGVNDDSAFPTPLDIEERFLDGRLEYRPLSGLRLEVLREYRRTASTAGPVIADYARFEADFRREIYPRLNLHTGLGRTYPLGDRRGEMPFDNAYGILDGRIGPGLEGRAELRAGRDSEDLAGRGIYWRRLLQARAVPRPSTRLQVTWTRDTRPLLRDLDQIDRQWELVAGYMPRPEVSLVGSMRWLDGGGRVMRHDRFADFTGSWRAARQMTLGVNWSQRRGEVGREATGFVATGETVTGVDLNMGTDTAYRTQLSWRRITDRGQDDTQTYALTVTTYFQ